MKMNNKRLGCQIATVLLTAFFVIAAVYFITGRSMGDVVYRSWFREFAWFSALLGVPISLTALINSVQLMAVDEEQGKLKKSSVVGIAALSIVCFLYLMIFSWLFLLFGGSAFEKEERVSMDVIRGTSEIWPYTDLEVHYYEHMNFLMKREYPYGAPEVVCAVLQERYGERFTVTSRENMETNGYIHTVTPENRLELVFHVYEIIGGWDSPGFTDDYAEVKANTIAMDYVQNFCPEREVNQAYNVSYPELQQGLAIVCKDREDAQSCAEDMAGMISYVMRDPFFLRPGSSSAFRIKYGGHIEKDKQIKFEFGYNSKSAIYVSPGDVNTDADYVYRQLLQEYDSGDAAFKEEQEMQEQTAPSVDENNLLTPEGAYEKLYLAVFEQNGDRYEVTYNAKGNFYGILGEDQEILNGESCSTRRTVVYDRISKNGQCQLFVAYKEYYGQDGSEYTTAILNFYAVDMQTGEVYVGDKTAWAENASAAYRKATGE